MERSIPALRLQDPSDFRLISARRACANRLRGHYRHEQGNAVGDGPVRKDHYATLGVTSASEDVVIRAAYHALMRRYHPDADPSAEAAERSRAINEAYAVLRDPEKRARYDATLGSQDLTFDPAAHPAPSGPRQSRIGPATAIAFALLAVGMITFAIVPPVADLRLPFGKEDRPADAVQPTRSKLAARASKQVASLCTDKSAAALIRKELFRQAGKMRGTDSELLRRAAEVSVVRVDPSTKDAQREASACTGWVALDLPPGLAVDGGRTNLNAEVSFGLAGSSRSLQLASLSGANRLVRTLATLGPAPKEPAADKPIEPAQVAAVVRKPVEPVATPPRNTRKTPDAKPIQVAQASTGCGRLTNRADQMICASGNLSSLDRQLSLLYRQSWDEADEKKRAALLGSRQRFNDRREACSSPNCMTTAYLSRLKEISDIMAGRAQR